MSQACRDGRRFGDEKAGNRPPVAMMSAKIEQDIPGWISKKLRIEISSARSACLEDIVR